MGTIGILLSILALGLAITAAVFFTKAHNNEKPLSSDEKALLVVEVEEFIDSIAGKSSLPIEKQVDDELERIAEELEDNPIFEEPLDEEQVAEVVEHVTEKVEEVDLDELSKTIASSDKSYDQIKEIVLDSEVSAVAAGSSMSHLTSQEEVDFEIKTTKYRRLLKALKRQKFQTGVKYLSYKEILAAIALENRDAYAIVEKRGEFKYYLVQEILEVCQYNTLIWLGVNDISNRSRSGMEEWWNNEHVKILIPLWRNVLDAHNANKKQVISQQNAITASLIAEQNAAIAAVAKQKEIKEALKEEAKQANVAKPVIVEKIIERIIERPVPIETKKEIAQKIVEASPEVRQEIAEKIIEVKPEAAPIIAAATAAAIANKEVMPKVKPDEFKIYKKLHPDYVAPSQELLNDYKSEVGAENDSKIDQESRLMAFNLNNTLDTFKISGRVSNVITSSRLIRFEITLDDSEKVKTIAALEKDFQRALKAKTIRLLAPIPGTDKIGIEVAHSHPKTIYFQDLQPKLEEKIGSETNGVHVALGEDLLGKLIDFDITKAPHVLIAGATGSGKSVLMNAVLGSIIYNYHPDKVRLALVDPKYVEFAMYKKIPHLLCDIVNTSKVADKLLAWVVNEMEARYLQLSKAAVKNIEAYNKNAVNNGTAELPYIVIVIDELADLMVQSAKSVEAAIQRISQKARAAGIHMVVATQKPTTDVITGVIKANFPARIAFSVASSYDSRTILDSTGAESLIGKGDMLVQLGDGTLTRGQGSYISDEEASTLVDYVAQFETEH